MALGPEEEDVGQSATIARCGSGGKFDVELITSFPPKMALQNPQEFAAHQRSEPHRRCRVFICQLD